MDKPRTYEAEYKKEAVKLAKEVGARKASESLKIPYGTLYDWIKKNERLKFIDFKTNGGEDKGKISFYCKALDVSRQAFYNYLESKDKPWKYEAISESMMQIVNDNESPAA